MKSKVCFRKEVWEDIPNYEGKYKVSSFGRVKSFAKKKPRILKQVMMGPTNTSKYYRVCLFNNGTSKVIGVHQLVAMAFLGHIPCGHDVVVDHINRDRLDNRLSNLRLVSNRANCLNSKDGKYSKLKGAHWCKQIKRWKSSIKIDGKVKRLGTFDTEEQAHKAYMNEYNKIEDENINK